ncbi:Galectin-3-binding protein [Branchiostoma belcheri]|nr:Galectin-3-binding protein [Branchiostoma belcheri]
MAHFKEVCFLLLSVSVLAETDESECPSPCSCSDQYSELVVSCGGRNLARIPAHLPPTTTWLDLKYNNITKVTSKSFKDTTQVKGINLSHNRIHKISVDAFKKLKHLDTIDLSQNLLKTISYDLFKVPIESAVRDGRRFFATLAINPWLCDCRLAWLADLFRNGSHMFSSRLVTCGAPKALKGLDVEDVPIAADISMHGCKHDGNMGFTDESKQNLRFVWVVLVAFLVANGVVYVHLLVSNGELSARLRDVEEELYSYRLSGYHGGEESHMPELGQNNDLIHNQPPVKVQRRSYRTEPREEKTVIDAPVLINARLVDGKTSNEGRLEVQMESGEWGVVCDDSWDIKDADVACRQLGYTGAVHGTEHSFFGEGSGKIWLDDVICTGSESNLGECQHNGWGKHNCRQDEAVGVVCAGTRRHHKAKFAHTQVSLLSVHILPRTEGIFTRWEKDIHEPRFGFEDGKLEILEPGKYFVYSQVEFTGDESDAGSKYSIYVGGNPYLTCMLPVYGDPPRYTCYTGGVLDLKYGDKVYIYVTTSKTCNIATDMDSTFFGAIKLSASN